jgi:hypothetical protein
VAFCALPAKPTEASLLNAYTILCRACESAQSFFTAFATVRKARKAKGTPTDHEQDLLRAALIFAAAGLDSMVKQLVRDTLRAVLRREKGARLQFADYVQKRLRRKDPVDLVFLSEALVAEKPFEHLSAELLRELTSSSLQSKDQLLSVAAYFAIPADEISGKPSELKDVFDVRNQIAHEMDVQFRQPNRSRRSRTQKDMKRFTSIVLTAAVSFYTAVEKRLL